MSGRPRERPPRKRPSDETVQARLRRLEAEGLITLPTQHGPPPPFEPVRPRPGGRNAAEAISADREERG